MPTKLLRAQIGLDGPRDNVEWERLRLYIHEKLEEYMDLSPDAVSPSYQTVALEEVINAITKDKSKYFATGGVKILRKYLIRRVNNIRHNGRRSKANKARETEANSSGIESTKTLARSSSRTGDDEEVSRPSASNSANRQAPYPTPRSPRAPRLAEPIRTRNEDNSGSNEVIKGVPVSSEVGTQRSRGTQVDAVSPICLPSHDYMHVDKEIGPSTLSDDEIGHRSRQPIHDQSKDYPPQQTSTSNRPTTTRLPFRDLDPLLDHDPCVNPPPPVDLDLKPEVDTKKKIEWHPHPGPTVVVKTEPKDEGAPPLPSPKPGHQRTEGDCDPELMDFLNTKCQRPLPHLYEHLRAYGCQSMDDLRKISEWPLSLITEVTMKMHKQARSLGETGATDGVIDWGFLANAIWSLGGRRHI